MVIVTVVLWIITALLWGLVLIVGGWQLYVGGFKSRKTNSRQKVENKQYTFAAVICARNEEAVIGKLIDSLHAQHYPREKFDVFVIADNCTDETAAVATQHGAYVYERFNDREIGKGFALRWALDKILTDHPGCYEAITIFDADNLVDPAYLYHTNEVLCTGADATQGYRESKNPFESVISGCYAIYWYMLSRSYHEARSRKGIPCSIGGTGFAFKTHMIEKNGWYTTTLTEDSEFACRKVLEGYHIEFARNAVFYDEQPTTWAVSVKQRMRWMCGVMQECRTLLKPAFEAWRSGNKNAWDIVMFTLSFPALAVALIAGVLSVLAGTPTALLVTPLWPLVLLIATGAVLATIYAVIFTLAFTTVRGEKGKIGKFWRAVLFYPLFLTPMAYFILVCFFKKDMLWETIPHDSKESTSA